MFNQDKYMKMIPEATSGEDLRAAYSVITGVKDQKNLKDIISYYSIQEDDANKWWSFFDMDSPKQSSGKRGRKSKDITGYLKSNIGKTVTPKQVSEEIGISLPTFYNFYNANRHFFKKVSRGNFEIVDPNVRN